MARLSSIRRDQAKQADGVWCAYEFDIRVRIRHIGYRPYLEMANQLTRPHRMRLTSDSLYTDELHRIVAPAVARHLVVAWENVEDDDGAPIACSPSEVERVLADERYADFLDWIIEQAREAQNYREAQHGDSVGKLRARLDWYWRVGRDAKKAQLVEKRLRRGESLREDWLPPPLFPDVVDAWEGWFELASARRVDGLAGPQLLGISEITAWLEMNGIAGQDRRLELYRLITLLDADWLMRHREVRELNRRDDDKAPGAGDRRPERATKALGLASERKERGRGGTFGGVR